MGESTVVATSVDVARGESSVRATHQLSTPFPGQPQEQMEVEENAEAEDNTVWPSGPKLWMNMTSMMLCCFLRGLDMTVVAVAVPSITNEFKSVSDIGWYSAVNGIIISSTCFFFGKVYTVFDVKKSYLMSIVVFWIGSIVCTFAPNSVTFIFGRSLLSFGAAWQGGGIMTQLNGALPMHKRPQFIAALMFTQTIAMVGAPIIGGALIRAFNWRACFGINIPLNFMALIFTAYGMQTLTINPDVNLPLKEKLKRLDLTGTIIFIPALTCLLLGLQWGSTTYGWNDTRIIVLLAISAVLLTAFAYLQYRLQDAAVLPPRILKQRSVLAGAWFTACCDGILAVTEYYMSIYFQGVRGLSPIKAGVLAVPMIVGIAAANIASGIGIPVIGYYSPFMIFTSIVAPVASGLLTTLDLDSQLAKAAGLLGLLGFAVGIGMQGPMMAISATLKPNDVAIGNAIITFGGGMGAALFVSTAAVLFQNRLGAEMSIHAPDVNATTIEMAGLSDIRSAIGQDQLRQVLTGYDNATVQTLYIPLALTVASIVGSALTEWRSVKKKQS